LILSLFCDTSKTSQLGILTKSKSITVEATHLLNSILLRKEFFTFETL